MRAIIAFGIVLVMAQSTFANPTWSAGSPSIVQSNGQNVIRCEGTASPGANEIVQIRVRAKGTTGWQVYGSTAYDNKTMTYTGSFAGLKSGDYEVEMVIMRNAQPPVFVSGSGVAAIAMP